MKEKGKGKDLKFKETRSYKGEVLSAGILFEINIFLSQDIPIENLCLETLDMITGHASGLEHQISVILHSLESSVQDLHKFFSIFKV